MHFRLYAYAAIVSGTLLTTCGRPAEERARAFFAMPRNTEVDSVTLRSAVLQLLPLGTSELEAARRLRDHGIGRDSLSHYYPPDSTGRAVVRIERDARAPNVVQTSYGIVLSFDTARILQDVQVHKWLTGP